MKPEDRISARLAEVGGFSLAQIMRSARARGALDLALGVPELGVPDEAVRTAVAAIRTEDNQYANTWGTQHLRQAVSDKLAACRGVAADPDTEVTITCGTTEGMFLALTALIDPGDEVVVFEPFYESYVAAVRLRGGIVRFVQLRGDDWVFDEAELRSAFNARTKAVLLNTPHNPTGKVFTRAELEIVARLCDDWNAVCVSDEVYEHMVFDGREHVSPLQLDSLRARSISLGSVSKTFRLSGWRLGYAVAPPALTQPLRKLHDLTTAGVVAPLQTAAAAMLRVEPSYYHALAADHQARRDRVMGMLQPLGFDCRRPQGSCFFLADVDAFGFGSDVDFVRFFIESAGIAFAPASGFASDPGSGPARVRVAFAKSEHTLGEAGRRLSRFRASAAAAGPAAG